jgi:hypothetical protein
MQRRQRVRFQCLTHGRQLYLKARGFLFRDDASIVDQCIQVAKALLQKLAQCRDALPSGRIQRVKLNRQILGGQLLYRFLASVGLAGRQYDLRAAAGQPAADFEADSAMPPVTTMIGLCSVMAVIRGAGV